VERLRQVPHPTKRPVAGRKPSNGHVRRGPAKGMPMPGVGCHTWAFFFLLSTRQVLEEIETQARNSQTQITVTKAALAAKQREIRRLELASAQIKGLPDETRLYAGVGRM
jgi:hypothetical protein